MMMMIFAPNILNCFFFSNSILTQSLALAVKISLPAFYLLFQDFYFSRSTKKDPSLFIGLSLLFFCYYSVYIEVMQLFDLKSKIILRPWSYVSLGVKIQPSDVIFTLWMIKRFENFVSKPHGIHPTINEGDHPKCWKKPLNVTRNLFCGCGSH